jgi:hypothetical protein
MDHPSRRYLFYVHINGPIDPEAAPLEAASGWPPAYSCSVRGTSTVGKG